MNCTAHNLIPAKLQCTKCGLYLCDMCIRTIDVQGLPVSICGHCGSRTVSLGILVKQGRDDSQGSFLGELIRIFAYPIRGNGLINLIIGTIFLITMNFITEISRWFLLMGYGLSIIIAGYLIKYYSAVVQFSAKGDKNPPGWGDIEFLDYWELVRCFFRTLFVVIFSFGAPLVLHYYFGENDPSTLYALVGFGVFYFPMAFLAVTYYESINALNPIAIFKSMGRAFGHYLVVVLFFYILIGLDWGLQVYIIIKVGVFADSLFLAIVLNRFVSLYLLTSLMHLLGIFLFYNKNKLNWQ